MTAPGTMPLRVCLAVVALAASQALADTPTSASRATQELPDGKTFLESVRSGKIDAETYDFGAAGFFRLSSDQRMQWLAGLFGSLGVIGQPGEPPCSVAAQRNLVAMTWAQVAGQSADADEWMSNADALRGGLAQLDRLVNRGVPANASADPLVQELSARFSRDQAVRSPSEQLKWTEGMPPVAAKNWPLALTTRMAQIDCDNTAWLQAQLATIGWFTISKYGAEADGAAWHLVQHADREPSFQRETLMKLKALPAGETDGEHLAMLVDRVARAEGRLQKYGTQGQCSGGQWTPFESEDAANLDERRTSLGLDPIAALMKRKSIEACPH